jgi:hypothetical protein
MAQQSPARMATETVVRSISSFLWTADYHKFCEVLNWPENNYSLQKWDDFRELCKKLDQFDIATLAMLVEAGAKK